MSSPVLLFRSRGNAFAVLLSAIHEVVESGETSMLPVPLPRLHSRIIGMAVWRGAVVSVILPDSDQKTSALTGDAPVESVPPILLVLRGSCGPFALACDALMRLESALPSSETEEEQSWEAARPDDAEAAILHHWATRPHVRYLPLGQLDPNLLENTAA